MFITLNAMASKNFLLSSFNKQKIWFLLIILGLYIFKFSIRKTGFVFAFPNGDNLFISLINFKLIADVEIFEI